MTNEKVTKKLRLRDVFSVAKNYLQVKKTTTTKLTTG